MNDDKDIFGNRMKDYEKVYTSQSISIDDVLCVRIDGKGFSKFTSGFDKPFDQRLTSAMVETTKDLVKQTHAAVGYTQSDEITLIFKKAENASEYIFGGKTSKINSVFASFATAFFNKHIKYHNLAFFDCRAWSVPDFTEASNVLLWRAQDARKNSVSAFFRWTLGHKLMENLNTDQMKAVLLEHGHDWSALGNQQKYGTYVKTALKKIAPNVQRSLIEEVDIGYYGDLSFDDRLTFIAGVKS